MRLEEDLETVQHVLKLEEQRKENDEKDGKQLIRKIADLTEENEKPKSNKKLDGRIRE